MPLANLSERADLTLRELIASATPAWIAELEADLRAAGQTPPDQATARNEARIAFENRFLNGYGEGLSRGIDFLQSDRYRRLKLNWAEARLRERRPTAIPTPVEERAFEAGVLAGAADAPPAPAPETTPTAPVTAASGSGAILSEILIAAAITSPVWIPLLAVPAYRRWRGARRGSRT